MKYTVLQVRPKHAEKVINVYAEQGWRVVSSSESVWNIRKCFGTSNVEDSILTIIMSREGEWKGISGSNDASITSDTDSVDAFDYSADDDDEVTEAKEEHYIICEACGNQIFDDENTCSNCGAKIKR